MMTSASKIGAVFQLPLIVLKFLLGNVAASAERLGDFIVGLLEVLGLSMRCGLAFLNPANWRPPVMDMIGRQVLFTAVEATPIAFRFSCALAVLIVVQVELLQQAIPGSERYLDSLVLRAGIREIGPLVAQLIVIGRSGTAMAVQIASMQLDGEIEVIESQGVDLLTYVTMPRAAATAIACFWLGLLIVICMTCIGNWTAVLLGASTTSLSTTIQNFEFQWDDAVFFLCKTLLAGLIIGAICVRSGLRATHSATQIPIAATRAGVASLSAALIISGVLSVVSYEKVLGLDWTIWLNVLKS